MADWDQNPKLMVGVICTDKVALAIVAHCQKENSDSYALVAYISDVQVFHPGKF